MTKNQWKSLDEACDKLRYYLSVCERNVDEDGVISCLYSILMYFLMKHQKDFEKSE